MGEGREIGREENWRRVKGRREEGGDLTQVCRRQLESKAESGKGEGRRFGRMAVGRGLSRQARRGVSCSKNGGLTVRLHYGMLATG